MYSASLSNFGGPFFLVPRSCFDRMSISRKIRLPGTQKGKSDHESPLDDAILHILCVPSDKSQIHEMWEKQDGRLGWESAASEISLAPPSGSQK